MMTMLMTMEALNVLYKREFMEIGFSLKSMNFMPAAESEIDSKKPRIFIVTFAFFG
jgi:hypothetical protein